MLYQSRFCRLNRPNLHNYFPINPLQIIKIKSPILLPSSRVTFFQVDGRPPGCHLLPIGRPYQPLSHLSAAAQRLPTAQPDRQPSASQAFPARPYRPAQASLATHPPPRQSTSSNYPVPQTSLLHALLNDRAHLLNFFLAIGDAFAASGQVGLQFWFGA